MSQDAFNFSLSIDQFDLTRLPISADVLRADRKLLEQAITRYYAELFKSLGGTANIAIAEGAVHVSWFPTTGSPRDLLLNHAVSMLQTGNYRQAEPILHSLHVRYPEDVDVLYNYGIVMSDRGQLDNATRMLENLVELEPGHSTGWTALGMARFRRDDRAQALEAFQHALELDPENAYALRNAGGLLSETAPSEALPLLEKAAQRLPSDQPTLLGYGSCLLRLGRDKDGDRVLNQCIAVNPITDTAEQARNLLTRLAHRSMRNAVGGNLRPDVVEYCLAALRLFQQAGQAKTGAITMEIAALGRSGLDINNPAEKYTLSSLPGNFSGMRLISTMYVGFKLLAPEHDGGIDLSREYAEAKRRYDLESGKATG